jgi:hypothetical protein
MMLVIAASLACANVAQAQTLVGGQIVTGPTAICTTKAQVAQFVRAFALKTDPAAGLMVTNADVTHPVCVFHFMSAYVDPQTAANPTAIADLAAPSEILFYDMNYIILRVNVITEYYRGQWHAFPKERIRYVFVRERVNSI